MNKIPSTSITLLGAIANDTSNARWTEFFRIYESPMRGFLRDRFPSLEADDVIQETMRALVKMLPEYRLTSDHKGHFRNYLMGIVKHKATDALRKRTKLAETRDELRDDMQRLLHAPEEDDSWKHEAMEAAVEQLMEDTSINPRTREIFRHVALLHKPPEDVATQFGVTRGNVDVIKKRMITKLSEMVVAMTEP